MSWLGAGGMGVVYRARDPRLGRDVAIKLIAETVATDANRTQRFEQEARAAGQLNHPNIVAVFDVGRHAGAPYIVSELLEGESLRARLANGALSPRRAIDYARQIAEGLAAAHERNIVHRDVKPDNLFITSEGRVKILDFGVAKLTRASGEAPARTGLPTETEAGLVVGTASYMSPEQVRGEAVDPRSDIFSFGAVLYEMLAGRPAFTRETAPETMTAILKEDPPALRTPEVSPSLQRIVSRCLEKTREMRFQSARDLAFGLEVLSDSDAAVTRPASARSPRQWRTATGIAIVLLSVMMAIVSWITRAAAPILSADDPLANAQFSLLTDWPGTEGAAEISPDGRFVAFLADRNGAFHLWLTQVGTGQFTNLTADLAPIGPPNQLLRSFGFTADGAEIWFSTGNNPGSKKMLIPLTGGTPRPFLDAGANSPAWSPDGSRLAYFIDKSGDPIFLADRSGADARALSLDHHEGTKGFFEGAMHNHNPVWSPDGQWIYFVHGAQPTTAAEIWRVRPTGGVPEVMTQQLGAVNFLTPVDPRTLLYVARTSDSAGPWLWSLDVQKKATRRISTGLELYTSVSASRNGKRVVASVANSTTTLWRVPVLDRLAEDRDVQPYPLPTSQAYAPRLRATSLFYLSSQGLGTGLWRYRDGEASVIWKNDDRSLSDPPAVSHDGHHLAIVVRKDGKPRLTIMSDDGTNVRTLTTAIDFVGATGASAADWSPDGAWIVTEGSDAQGPGLFKIPVAAGAPIRLVSRQATNPIWSPDGTLIVYAVPSVAGQRALQGVRPDGTPVDLPDVRTRLGAGGYRFLPDGKRLVYIPRNELRDFWMLDLAAGTTRQLTRLSDQGRLNEFDITPDGKEIVFDRLRENSNIVLIDLPK